MKLWDSLTPVLRKKLFGVIDLRRGKAVHAVAGQRDRYEPVKFCDGDPSELLKHYLQLGVGGVYVADLDALTDGALQHEAIQRICEIASPLSVLVDVGWPVELARLPANCPNAKWIAATESCQSIGDLEELVSRVTGDHAVLGLDFRGGEMIGNGSIDDWVQTARRLAIHGVVALDLAAVGTGTGVVTGEICRDLKAAAPELVVYSGGGIRNDQDLQDLVAAGCDGCLVATALQVQS